MKNTNLLFHAMTMITVSAIGLLPALGQLPIMTEKEHLGYFVLSKSKAAIFSVTGELKTEINILEEDRSPVAQSLAIEINFRIEETTSGGKVVSHKINKESLSSEQLPTAKLKEVTIKGKTEGDTGIDFELFISENRGIIMLGGRLLNAATSTHPVRFMTEVSIPNTLPKAKDDNGKKNKKESEDKIKGDKFLLTRLDGKKLKFTSDNVVNASSAEVSGAGLTALALDLGAYKGKKIQFTASTNSSIVIDNSEPKSLGQGFKSKWSADITKDPDGKARLAIDVR
jgi:hypothetical protein